MLPVSLFFLFFLLWETEEKYSLAQKFYILLAPLQLDSGEKVGKHIILTLMRFDGHI